MLVSHRGYLGHAGILLVAFVYLVGKHTQNGLAMAEDAPRRLEEVLNAEAALVLPTNIDIPTLPINDLETDMQTQAETMAILLADPSLPPEARARLQALQDEAVVVMAQVRQQAEARETAVGKWHSTLGEYGRVVGAAVDAARHTLRKTLRNTLSFDIARRMSEGGTVEAELNVNQQEQVKLEQLELASRISVFFSALFFACLAFYIIIGNTEADASVVQRSSLRKRLEYTLTVNLYICFFSCLFNIVQLGDEDNVDFGEVNHTLDLGRPIEWILTCPLMQLCVVIVGGEKVPDYRRWTLPMTSLVILCCGLTSALMVNPAAKLIFYIFGAANFIFLVYQMNECVRNASDDTESMLYGSSVLRTLVLIVFFTWIPFPAWYALSPEGFNVITNSPMMKVVVAFLNVFSKGAFTLYLIRVRDDLKLREKLKANQEIMEMRDNHADEFRPSNELAALVQETLASMGRNRDLEPVMEIISKNMITTPDDVLVLTKAYCMEIGLPWAFVFAFKDKWRRGRAHKSDAWQLQKGYNRTDEATVVSPAAPHVALNPQKLDKVLSQRIDRSERHNDDASDTMTPRAHHDGHVYGHQSTVLTSSGGGGANSGQLQALQAQLEGMRRQRDQESMELEARIKERMQAMMSDQVNRTVMDVLNRNLKRQREGDEDENVDGPGSPAGSGFANGY
jgi:bacteriorhodopsin